MLNNRSIIADHPVPLYLNSSQLIIAFPRLDQACQPGIASQVHHLLRLGIRPESHFPVNKHIPHCHQVRKTVSTNSSHLECMSFFEECAYFLIAHTDEITAIHMYPPTRERVGLVVVTFGFAMQQQAKPVAFALQHQRFCIISVQALLCSMTKCCQSKLLCENDVLLCYATL